MQVSKDEFVQWLENPVTKEVFEVIEGRIMDAKDILGATAGEDPTADRYLVGMIRAFNELKGIEYDD
jgi:hypothetical protein